MNTLKLKLFLLTTFAMVMTGCATPQNTEATAYMHLPYDYPPFVKVHRTQKFIPGKDMIVALDLAEINVAQDMGKRVFAEVVGSPRLTAKLINALSMAGLNLVQTRDRAEVVYELEGNFEARGALYAPLYRMAFSKRDGRISLAGYAERPSDLVARVPGRTAEADDAAIAKYGFPSEPNIWVNWKPIYEQNAEVSLTRVEGGIRKTTKVHVSDVQDYLMVPTFIFQACLDTLVKSVGLPRNSLRIGERSAGI
jgi:hypothetical protein